MKKYEVCYIYVQDNRSSRDMIIEAENFTIENDGVLVFWTTTNRVAGMRVAAFAPGQWVSVQEVKCECNRNEAV